MPTLLKLSLIYFTLLFSYLTLTTATDFPPCNAQDKAVLLKVRDHFGGPNGRLSDWENDTDCCSEWSFVACGTSGRAYGRIDSVTFSRSWGLSGTIPSDFGDLPYLGFFILADNINVTGTIPKSFGKLKNLYHIELDTNSLTGPIPNELFKLKKLKEVDLSANQLSGPIPPSVTSLLSLSQFNVSHNKLSGSIPPMPKSLKSIDVSNNQLCGPIPSGLKGFKRASFEHNKCLCGPPLAAGCK
ncbi:polygalacturonase inhibitor 1-like [Chenopodium quinoa]|uniref:polygalacturonase inhibitor 1-like n=1 Tax=Chenopodium quinoa TaxID=63459 RepID=UPI000B76D949|nr:polygalacturonase inhibitor 1-like [Chenopodium quinoa]